MTLDTVLTIALDVAFFAVFGLTLVDYLRHREPVRRTVVLVFASLAVVLAVPIVQAVVPAIGPVIGIVAAPAFLAQPVLVLWLVTYVRPVPRLALRLAILSGAGITVGFLSLRAMDAPAGAPGMIAVSVAMLVYFALLEGAAAAGLALAARRRAGASRTRLLVAALATALLGLAVVVLLGAGLVATPGSAASPVVSASARVMALLSALGYLVAFVPPRGLRRLSQQSIVYDFIRELNAMPSGSPITGIWALIERMANAASGATRAKVVETGADEPPPPGIERRTFAFHSSRWPDGRLELDVGRHALFLDDDFELIGLIVERGARAAERELFLLERERLIGELQAASAAKSDFLAAMSHELRTPLNAIIGFSELLREGGDEAADPATVTAYAEHIHASGLHLLELVNDVLDLARVEAGRLDLKPVHLELDALVRQTVASMQPLADQKRQTMTLQLSPVAVEADASRIRQIVLNLLSNAIKFTDPGGEIRLSLGLDEAGAARLTVADTGRGISSTDIDRIFEAFQQGGSGSAPAHHEGTGLGLALTRQLVDAHGGSVTVTSEVGVGSEFTVQLPVQRAPDATWPDRAPQLPGGRPSVLVIEDDPAARELLRLQLEGAGYGVLATPSGQQGLAWVAETLPDAVLLDILLPDMDGWEILQRLKADPATRAIPVMVVSVVDDRQLGLALGAVDYFVKPVSREPLLEAIGRLTFTTKVRTRTVTALVIDPDPEAADRYRQLLEPDGFRVIGAHDGASGRRRAIDERPDLILLDALLPDVDGFELASTLHHDPATSAIPVWLMTPAGIPAEARERLNGNIQGVLARGEDAHAAMRAWLETGRPPAVAPGVSSGSSLPSVPESAMRESAP